MTNFLWIPEQTPPIVSNDAAISVRTRMLSEGIGAFVSETVDRLRDEQGPYSDFITELGRKARASWMIERNYTENAMEAIAAIGYAAYVESGFKPYISSDTIELGTSVAELEGLPDAYLSSLAVDDEMNAVLSTALKNSNREGAVPPQDIVHIAAGSLRFHMQNALIAA